MPPYATMGCHKGKGTTAQDDSPLPEKYLGTCSSTLEYKWYLKAPSEYLCAYQTSAKTHLFTW